MTAHPLARHFRPTLLLEDYVDAKDKLEALRRFLKEDVTEVTQQQLIELDNEIQKNIRECRGGGRTDVVLLLRCSVLSLRRSSLLLDSV
jgi:hypothetical protein